MADTGSYNWKTFYSDLADKLLLFRNDRKKLIDDFYDIFERADMRMPKFEIDGRKADDLDPFTVFALFNRGITNKNRTKIAEEMKVSWNIEAEAPTEFDGIPVMNNLMANFLAHPTFCWSSPEDSKPGTSSRE